MKYLFNHIDEKDIDLLLVDRIFASKPLQNLFKTKIEEIKGINLQSYEITCVRHSAESRNGESDIEVTLSSGDMQFLLYIEDKIDAIAQPNQAGRYKDRGQIAINDHRCNDFITTIVAPRDYLSTNAEAQKYEAKISYQELKEALKDDVYAQSLLDAAVAKEKIHRETVNQPAFTALHERASALAKELGIHAKPKHRPDQKHGENSWVDFRSAVPNTKIRWRAERGIVSLDFSKWSQNAVRLKELVGELPEGLHWRAPDSTKSEYLEIKNIPALRDWETAAREDEIIAAALQDVETLWLFAGELNDRPIDWDAERKK